MNLLSDIISYVRRIIKTSSNQQVTDATIIDYINRFYQYDVPARVQLFELKTIFSFLTVPLVDQYNLPYITTTPGTNNVLQYQMIEQPCYCDGVEISLQSSRDLFFKAYPNNNFNEQLGQGDGVTTSFTFTTSFAPILRANIDVNSNLFPAVYIAALDINNNQMQLNDDGTFGVNANVGNLTGDGTGTVNYQDGTVSVTFNSAPQDGLAIQIKYVPFTAGPPRLSLVFDNIVTLRPVPDIAYLMQFDAYLTPSAFLSSGQSLAFGYMSEYLARGAARKMLSDTGDIEQFQFYEPFFREQEAMVLRRTNRQQSITRTPTIFSDLSSPSSAAYPTNQGF